MRTEFDPSDPFPRMTPRTWEYRDQIAHGRAADAWLGLQISRTETEIASRWKTNPDLSLTGTQAWVGLSPDSLQTPYTELRQMLDAISPPPGSIVCDLGAGYGRMGFVIQRHFPEAEFLGLELVGERVKEGAEALARHECSRARLVEQDLAAPDFELPRAAAYFLYDFGSREAITRILGELRLRARTEPVTVIGRGRATRDSIERGEPWLSQVSPPIHFDTFSIYRSG